MGRYQAAPPGVKQTVEKIRETYFPILNRAQIVVLMDSKKKEDKGRIVFGSIIKPNELAKHFAAELLAGEVNYVLILDRIVWEALDQEEDGKLAQERIIRHELRHCFHDIEAADPWKIIGHEIEDFIAEVELNREDPGWRNKLARLAIVAHELAKGQGAQLEMDLD